MGGIIFVEVCKNNGINYLRLVNGVRVDGKNGNKTIRKKVILNIGPLLNLMTVNLNMLED